jgi:hypothetical protein
MSDTPDGPALVGSRRGFILSAPLALTHPLLNAQAAGQAAPLTGMPPFAVSVADWGAKGGNARGDAEAIQRAFDEAPVGAELHFPPAEYLITRPLRLRRRIDLVGNGAYLAAGFTGADLLTVNIEDPVNRDNRNQTIRGLRLALATGPGSALKITNRAPNLANIGMVIENNVLAGPAEGPGNGLWLEGLGTHHLVIRSNQIENGIQLSTADGVTIENCLIFGLKTAITLDLIEGAFQTRIFGNALVARDGALLVRNGSQIYFEHNTVEQFAAYGDNRSARKAHLAIQPGRYGSRHIQVVGNNFGGGDHVGPSIHVSGDCRNLLIDRNVFNVNAAGADVVLADPAVGWTRLGPNNTVRGPAARRAHLAAGETLAVQDRGTGTFGTRTPGALQAASPWRAQGAAVRKSLDHLLQFQGAIVGQGPAGSVIARLAPGFRPLADAIVMATGEGGVPVALRLETAGAIRLQGAFGGSVHLDGIAVSAALPPPPPPTDP